MALTAFGPSAYAELSAGELFDRGLTAMKRGDYAAACPAFAESFKLDPLPGAMFTLAECEARAGMVASAWLHFGEFAAMIGRLPRSEQGLQVERLKEAERRRAELTELIPWLTVRLPAPLPQGATLTIDRQPIDRARWAKPLPLDPGVRRVVLRNPDGGETQRTVQLERGERREVTLERPAARPKPEAPPPEDTGTALMAGGYVTLAVAVAGLATAGGVGISLLGRKDTIEANCDGNQCNAVGYEEAEAVSTLNVVGSVAFAVGVTALVASVPLLWVGATADDEPSAVGFGAPAVEPSVAVGLAPTVGGSTLRVNARW